MTIYHKDLNGGNIHTLVCWEFNNAAERTGIAGLTAADVGKFAWQKDNDTFWVLKNHVGPAWAATGAPFGTTAGTACEGNDSRLSDARTPVSHAIAGAEHSSSTLAQLNAKISDAILISTNDSRLSDARTPVAHNQDASTITTGTFDIARLPAGALDRLVIVSDEAARFALTTASVQTGDTVKQTSPAGTMYRVIDDTKLNQADGYVEYSAARAAAVDWAGVENKPASFTPASHAHGNLTNTGTIGSTASVPIITGAAGVLQAGSFGTAVGTFCQGNDSRLSDARTPSNHNLIDTTKHPVSGLTAGHYIRATSATTYAFSGIQAADVPILNQNTTGTATNATNCGRSILSGNGMNFTGGALNADRTITLGTPGNLNAVTTSAVTTNSHTHSMGITVSTAAPSGGVNGDIWMRYV